MQGNQEMMLEEANRRAIDLWNVFNQVRAGLCKALTDAKTPEERERIIKERLPKLDAAWKLTIANVDALLCVFQISGELAKCSNCA